MPHYWDSAKTKMMNEERYFIVSVLGSNGHATFPLSVNGYPSKEAITIIAEAAGLKNTAIMNIIELPKQDYEDFNKEELK